MFKWAIYHAAKEAGCEVNMEPKTENLLLKQFTADQCKVLFPKKPSKSLSTHIGKLGKELVRVETMKHGQERDQLKQWLSNEYKLLHRQHLTKGLRIDVQIIDQHTGHQRWVDTTCIHPTCQSRIQTEWKDTQTRISSYESAIIEG